MSTDQRPRREVMVDAPPKEGQSTGADGIANALPPVPAKPRVLLPAIVFLLACAAGAVGLALILPDVT